MTTELHPLAPAQELLWEFMTALSPDDPTATREVVSGSCLLEGTLDADLLRVAVDDVAGRHDVLRMTVPVRGPDPLVRIRPLIDVEFLENDLSGMPEHQRREEAAHVAARDQHRTFDLERGPLWQVRLLRLSPTEHVFSYVFCHLVADGWASRVFVEEVVRAYRVREGGGVPPDERAWGLADISRWQRRLLDDLPNRAAFWREQLTPLPGYFPFPALPTTPETNLVAETAEPFRFSPEVVQGLRRVAWRARTTPYVVLMAAHHVVLARRTGSRRVIVATTTSGRDAKHARRAIGQFTNDIHVAVRVDPAAPCLDVVRDVHRAVEAAERNALPYKALAAAVNPAFADSRPWPDNHLFDAYFQADPPAPADLELPGLAVRWAPFDGRGTSEGRPPLPAGAVPPERVRVWTKHGCPDVIVDDAREGGAFVYNPSFYDGDFVRGLVAEYTEVVEAVVATPPRAAT